MRTCNFITFFAKRCLLCSILSFRNDRLLIWTGGKVASKHNHQDYGRKLIWAGEEGGKISWNGGSWTVLQAKGLGLWFLSPKPLELQTAVCRGHWPSVLHVAWEARERKGVFETARAIVGISCKFPGQVWIFEDPPIGILYERQWGDIYIFCSLIHFPNVCSSQSWTTLNQETRTPSTSLSIAGSDRTHVLKPLSSIVPMVYISKKWQLKAKLGLKPRPSDLGTL